MRYFFRLLKFFFLSTIIWGTLVGLALGLRFGIMGKAILYGIEIGFIFSFIITISSILYDYFFRRMVFSKFGVKSFDVIQIRDLIFKGNMNDIFQKSITVLKSIKTIIEIFPDYNIKKVTARTKTSVRTFGEKIEVSLFEKIGEIHVRICSRPRLKTSIIDCGKNIENVELICSLLKKNEDREKKTNPESAS